MAFIPLLGSVTNLLLVPICLIAAVVGIVKTIRQKRGLAAARLYFIALLLAIISIPLLQEMWERSRYCQGLDHNETVQLINSLQKLCEGMCCSDMYGPASSDILISTGNTGKARSFYIEDIKDHTGKCRGFTIHFTRTWPCHDDDWSWSSDKPKVFKVDRGAYNADGYEALKRMGYTFEFDR